MARCAGPPARWILLPAADPTELSPGWSHSRPVSDSQPSGLRRSALCSARQAAVSFCQGVSCDAAGPGSSANSRAMKVRQVERPLKRMREYSVEENALKTKLRMSMPASTADHGGRDSPNYEQISEQQKYSSLALPFSIQHALNHGKCVF